MGPERHRGAGWRRTTSSSTWVRSLPGLPDRRQLWCGGDAVMEELAPSRVYLPSGGVRLAISPAVLSGELNGEIAIHSSVGAMTPSAARPPVVRPGIESRSRSERGREGQLSNRGDPQRGLAHRCRRARHQPGCRDVPTSPRATGPVTAAQPYPPLRWWCCTRNRRTRVHRAGTVRAILAAPAAVERVDSTGERALDKYNRTLCKSVPQVSRRRHRSTATRCSRLRSPMPPATGPRLATRRDSRFSPMARSGWSAPS